MYLHSFQLIYIVCIPFTSRLEMVWIQNRNVAIKMYKHIWQPSNYPTKCLSIIIVKIIPTEVKIKFRNLEKISLEYSASKAHRQFNITCINKKLLSVHTNTYIIFIGELTCCYLTHKRWKFLCLWKKSTRSAAFLLS